ncbi:hypothetical protein niasHT_037053 [Heterodera trifolii]|uniref:Serum response factor homolog n=1 Tax=Heterodera trifolii TaxID=157864 RepID=A0ABD2IVM0_9BILA
MFVKEEKQRKSEGNEKEQKKRERQMNSDTLQLQSELEKMLAHLGGTIKKEEEKEEEEEEENGEELEEEEEESEEDEEEEEEEEQGRGRAEAHKMNNIASGVLFSPATSFAPTLAANPSNANPSNRSQSAFSTLDSPTTPKTAKGKTPKGTPTLLPNGKKTKGRVKIKMEYIGNKLRRYTTFSKRKTGIMKKANELSTLTGTQVMLLVASETGHVYAFATSKLKPMILCEPGKQLIQGCLNAADVVDPMPTKTEFTFEPSALGISPIGGNGSNARKRKIGGEPQQSGEESGEGTLTGTGTTNSADNAPTMVQLAKGGGAIGDEVGTEAEQQQRDRMGPAKKKTKRPAEREQNDDQQQKGQRRAKEREDKEEKKPGAASLPLHSLQKPSPSSSPGIVTTMDAQQLQKTLKEVLKAAADQRQRSKGQKVKGMAANGTTPTTAKGNTNKTTPQGENSGGRPLGAQQQQTSVSQSQLMALLPLLLQNLLSPSFPLSSHLPSAHPLLPPSSPLSAISSPASPRLSSHPHGHHHQQRSSSSPFCLSSSATHKFPSNNFHQTQKQRHPPPFHAFTNAKKHDANNKQTTHPPILYQMPQGVVYATEERDGTAEEVAGEEGLNAHFEEAEDANSGSGGEGVDRLMETGCLAVCSSASSSGPSSSSSSSLVPPFSDETATGNALQQLLTAGLLPFAAANLTAQQIFSAVFGTTKSSGSGGEPKEDED